MEYHLVSRFKLYTTKYYFNLSKSNWYSLNTLQLYLTWVSCFMHCHYSTYVLARVRFPAYNSLVGTLQKRCGQDLIKEVRALEKLDFKEVRNIQTTRNSCRDALSCANMALKLPWYFYLLMEKPLSHYFQVWSPYYQMVQCN